MKRLVILAGLCATAGAIAAPVSYENRGVLLPVLLDQIASQSGEKYEVAPLFRREIVQMRVKAVDSEEIHARLAKILGGTWTRTDSGALRLDRTAEQQAAFEKADRETVRKSVKERHQRGQSGDAGETVSAPIADDPDVAVEQPAPVPPEIANASKAWQKIETVFAEAVQSLDIYGMGLHDRISLSTAPRGRQRKGLAALIPAIENFNRAAQAAARFEDSEYQRVNRISVSITRTSPYQYSVTRFIEQPESVTTSQSTLGQSGMFFGDISEDEATPSTSIKLNEPEKVFTPPDSVTALIRVAGQMSGGIPPAKEGFTEAFRFMMNPLENDPLSTVPAEIMIEVAKDQKKENILAVLTDSTIQYIMNNAEGVLRRGSAMRQLEQAGRLQVSADGTFVMAEPVDKSLFTQTRLDRKALQTMIDLGKQQGGHTLEQWGEFAATYPELSESMFQLYSVLVFKSGIGMMIMPGESGQMHAFRMYHLLSPPDREALKQGGSIPVFRLPRDRHRFVELMSQTIINNLPEPSLEASEMANPFTFGGMSGSRTVEGSPRAMDVLEFTDAQFSQFALNGLLMKEIVAEPGDSTGFLAFLGPLSPRAIAPIKFSIEAAREAGQDAIDAMLTLPTVYRVGQSEILAIQVLAGRGVGAQHYLRATRVDPTKPAIPLASFPPAFLAALEKAEAEFKKQIGNRPGMESAPGDGIGAR